MAIINYDFYSGEDKYSDGDIENYIRYLVENQIDINSLAPHEKTYPVFYHLSHLRENIINWYPIGKHQDVLEIGAGCGAITGVLCRKAGNVVSVELSKRRAEINYQRNKHADNLLIYVGNQSDIAFDRKFDFVILNGVFEYAMSFTEGTNPYRTFLEKCMSFLKPDGKLLIAIENRLGLKYFTGAAEDHTGNYFLGVNQYPENNTVRTFSKSEWIKLLNSCNLNCKFYYPYPDYKFPVEIFTDTSLTVNGYGKPYCNLEENRYSWIHEYDLAKTLSEEGIVGSFANSFFLEITASDEFANIDYCKISCDRREDCRIITSIVNDTEGMRVEKRAASPAAVKHIEAIYRNSNAGHTAEIYNLSGRFQKDRVSFAYIEGETLSNRMLYLLEQKDVVQFKTEMVTFFHDYFAMLEHKEFVKDDEFEELFGNADVQDSLDAVCGGNIDLIFDNVFCTEKGKAIIDPEWVFSFAIPKSFIMWRSVHDFYRQHPGVEEQLPESEMLTILGVKGEHTAVFNQWNIYFTYCWLKANSVEQFVKPIHFTTMDYMVSLHRGKTMLICGLYYDCGSGYTEEKKLIAEVPLNDNHFSATFDLSQIENIKCLRFDPVEGVAIRCAVHSEDVRLVPVNACAKEDQFDVFITEDPIYDVVFGKLPENGRVHISGCVMPLAYKEKAELSVKELVREKEQEVQLYKAQQEISVCNYEKLIANYSHLQCILQQIQEQNNTIQAELYAKQAEIGDNKTIIERQEAQLTQYKDQIKDMADDSANWEQKAQSLENQLQKIFQSKGWKLLVFLQRLKKVFIR